MEDAKAQYSGKLEHTPPLVFHPKHPLRLAWTLFMVRACVHVGVWVSVCMCMSCDAGCGVALTGFRVRLCVLC